MATKSTRSSSTAKAAKAAASMRTPRALARLKVASQGRSAHFNEQAAFRASGSTFFEAASNAARLQPATGVGPNAANGEFERIRNRSRRTYANDAFYRQACRQMANNLVHYGIKPANIKDPVLLKLWKKWVKEADARGRMDFYGIQWLLALVVAREGEGFVRFRSRKPGDMKSGINFQIQCLEADYVPLDKSEVAPNGNIIISGVERDLIERVVAYWIYDYHPRDLVIANGNGGLPKRVPASDILHVYMPDRFSDTRGYAHGAAALNTSDSRKTFDDAHLEGKKSQAMNVGFVTKPRDEEAPTFDTEGVDEDGVQYIGYEPNTLSVLPEGHDVKFSSPTPVDPNYGAYKREVLSELAVAFGMAVELITLNFEKVNDRQYRAIMLECQRYFESLQYHMIVKQFAEPVWNRFVDEAYLAGLWEPEDGKTVDDYKDPDWMTPARGTIHPLQEIAAFSQAVRDGFTSRKRVAASFGEDIEDIDDENESDQLRAQDKNLRYPVYPALDVEAVLQEALMEEAEAETETEQLAAAE
jgi:lambda family phage portal protein